MIWREATREDLYEYYTGEFPGYVEELPGFITPTGPKEFGIAFRESYPVRKQDEYDRDFIRRRTWLTDNDGVPIRSRFSTWDDLERFIQHPARYDPLGHHPLRLVDPDIVDVPEPFAYGVYYAADHWDRPWLLFVDIDAKDIARERALENVDEAEYETEEDLLNAVDILDTEPAGYPYTFEDLERALEYGFDTRSIFEEEFAAEYTVVVYSGQGAHVYLLDDDIDHRYDAKSREVLNDFLLEEFEIPIDPVVTADRSRLIRLPYSLHAGVSRIVQPIDSPDFDFRIAAQPQFLQHHESTNSS